MIIYKNEFPTEKIENVRYHVFFLCNLHITSEWSLR